METNAIVPSKSIGIFQLGWTKKELFSHFCNGYKIKDLSTEQKIFYRNFHFWVNKETQTVKQISVINEYDGKFSDKIGIGSTLKDIENYFGKWQEDLDVYIIPEYKGICFEVKDVDDFDEEWIEDQMPINVISVYDSKNNDIIN